MIQVPIEDGILVNSSVESLRRNFAAADVAPFPPKRFLLQQPDQLQRKNRFIALDPIVVVVVVVVVAVVVVVVVVVAATGFEGAAFFCSCRAFNCKQPISNKLVRNCSKT